MWIERHVEQSDMIDGTGYRMPPDVHYYAHLEADDRALHESTHQQLCWCDGLDDDQFFRELFRRCLAGKRFGWLQNHAEGRVISRGPGMDEGRTDELEAAIRSCAGRRPVKAP